LGAHSGILNGHRQIELLTWLKRVDTGGITGNYKL
jgi:hypothetical protein